MHLSPVHMPTWQWLWTGSLRSSVNMIDKKREDNQLNGAASLPMREMTDTKHKLLLLLPVAFKDRVVPRSSLETRVSCRFRMENLQIPSIHIHDIDLPQTSFGSRINFGQSSSEVTLVIQSDGIFQGWHRHNTKIISRVSGALPGQLVHRLGSVKRAEVHDEHR